jgi:hypothetical protein
MRLNAVLLIENEVSTLCGYGPDCGHRNTPAACGYPSKIENDVTFYVVIMSTVDLTERLAAQQKNYEEAIIKMEAQKALAAARVAQAFEEQYGGRIAAVREEILECLDTVTKEGRHRITVVIYGYFGDLAHCSRVWDQILGPLRDAGYSARSGGDRNCVDLSYNLLNPTDAPTRLPLLRDYCIGLPR